MTFHMPIPGRTACRCDSWTSLHICEMGQCTEWVANVTATVMLMTLSCDQ